MACVIDVPGEDEPYLFLIDDDELVRRSTARLLRSHAFRVGEARSVDGALRLLAIATPDAVVSDFNLLGETAADVYAALKQPQRFVLYTGNSEAVVADAPRIMKPDHAALLAQLKAWFTPASS